MEELDLKQLFGMFWNKKVYIILIVAIFMVIGIIYSFIFVKPEYKAETTLLLAMKEGTSNNQGATSITQTDVTLNQKLVSTYGELIKSKKVVSQVISNLKLDETYESLKRMISVSQKKDTEIIRINVANADPQKSKIITNEIAKVFATEVTNFFNINNVNVVDEAEVPLEPYNINHIKDIILFMAIGVVVSVGYVLIANMLDTTVKSEEDIEKQLKLTVLATVPLYSMEDNKGGRR